MEHVNSGRSWSPELRVFLIHCVKPRERLWRKYGTCGTDNDARMTLWGEIQEEINKEYEIYIDVDEIKKTWKNLKDNFLRVKKASNGEGNSKPGGKKWFFYDELRFLDYADVLTDQKPDRTRPFHSLAPDIETEESIEPVMKKARDENSEQISIPIIDNRINTKQKVPIGVTVLNLDDDLVNIAKLTAGKWGETHPECCPPGQKNLDTSIDDRLNTFSATPPISICITEQKPFPGIDSIKEEKPKIRPDLCNKIVLAIQKMRSDYQKAAMNFLLKKGMQSGKMKKALDDFDNYIYYRQQRTEEMNMIIQSCPQTKQNEFEQVFILVEKFRDQLVMELPSRKWEEFDKGIEYNQKPIYSEQRNPLNVELTTAQNAFRKRAKILQTRKLTNHHRIVEVQREIDRINGELLGQPSVIRRTKLKKMLEESENEMATLIAQRTEIEYCIKEHINEADQVLHDELDDLPSISHTVKVEHLLSDSE